MRFVRPRNRRKIGAVEITPMIDVVFLLIIFFMTTAQFARQTRSEVDLPKQRGEQRDNAEEAGLVINITATGEIIVATRPVDLDELRSLIHKEIDRVPERLPRDMKMLIRADQNAEARRLNQVTTLLHSLGIGAARIATEVP